MVVGEHDRDELVGHRGGPTGARSCPPSVQPRGPLRRTTEAAAGSRHAQAVASIWPAFHVIGTVFDKTHTEGLVGRHAQTVNIAPSQGGWVELTLDEEGAYPFVTHAFGDMVKGSVGVLATAHAPGAAMHH